MIFLADTLWWKEISVTYFERRLFALCLLATENFATFRSKSKIKAMIDVYGGCIYSHCALV